jgi:hypothetical protein
MGLWQDNEEWVFVALGDLDRGRLRGSDAQFRLEFGVGQLELMAAGAAFVKLFL